MFDPQTAHQSKETMQCRLCDTALKKRANGSIGIYCSQRCQMDFQYNVFIEKWKAGLATGWTGKTRELSHYVRRYVRSLFGTACSQCGWDEHHPIDGRPLTEIDHIDGDVENCRPENLKLLCPNCHSLTDTFGSLNRGKGKRPHHKGGYLTPD